MNKTLRTTAIACALASVVMLVACAGTKTSESTGAYVDDSAITGKVKTAILEDPALKVMQIHVDTYKNVVQLSGFVDTPQMIGRAGTVARQVSGVASVQNDLVVK
jgi:osmotically-inducible protein OsmY